MVNVKAKMVIAWTQPPLLMGELSQAPSIHTHMTGGGGGDSKRKRHSVRSSDGERLNGLGASSLLDSVDKEGDSAQQRRKSRAPVTVNQINAVSGIYSPVT